MADEDKTAEGGFDLNTPEVQQAIREAVDAEVTGLKSKNSELLGKMKQYQENLKQWDGFDPDQVKQIFERINKDEETRLISEGKLEEVLSKRTERMKSDYDKQFKSRDDKIAELEKALTQKSEQLNRHIIDGNVRDAASRAGIHPTAIDDAVMLARAVFELDDHQRPVARDENGDLVMSKDAKNPLDPAGWLEDMKEKRPHWWPASQGGGATPGRFGKPSPLRQLEEQYQQAVKDGNVERQIQLKRALSEERRANH